jgi:hypothetical protein
MRLNARSTFRLKKPRTIGAAVKAAARRLRRWPAASLDRGSDWLRNDIHRNERAILGVALITKAADMP